MRYCLPRHAIFNGNGENNGLENIVIDEAFGTLMKSGDQMLKEYRQEIRWRLVSPFKGILTTRLSDRLKFSSMLAR